MRDVYAARFELGGTGGGEDLLGHAAKIVLDWAIARYHLDAPGDVLAGELDVTGDRAVWGTSQSRDGRARLWDMQWRQRADQPGLVWRVAAQIADRAGAATFTIRIALESDDLRIAPVRYDFGRPNVVRSLAASPGARADGRVLTPSAEKLLSDDVGRMVALVLDSERRLPVIAVSPAPGSGRALIDPDRLADRTLGLAHVYSLESSAATFELTDRMTPSFSVFQGAVRLYWPGVDLAGDPYAHPLWLPERVRAIEASQVPLVSRIERLLANVSVVRIPLDPLARELRDERDRDTLEQVSALQAQLAKRVGDPSEAWLKELEGTLDHVGFMTQEIRRLESEKRELQDEVDRLQKSFSDYAAALRTAEPAPAETAIDDGPITSVVDAVRRAAAVSPNVVYLDEAFEGASRSGYPQPDRVLDALTAIGDVAAGWAGGTLGTGFRQAFDERGFEYRDDVGNASSKWPDEYRRSFDGGAIVLGPHLVLGRGTSADNICRVYWALDEVGRRFVVGHVGRHLRYEGS